MRANFSNRFGFMAAATGCALGLGNIWKFPFEVGKGGGAAFLLLYLLFFPAPSVPVDFPHILNTTLFLITTIFCLLKKSIVT